MWDDGLESAAEAMGALRSLLPEVRPVTLGALRAVADTATVKVRTERLGVQAKRKRRHGG